MPVTSIRRTKNGKQRVDKKTVIMAVIIIAVLVAVQIVNNNFLTPKNLLIILKSIPSTSIVAFGFTLILLTGGMDLSCGYMLTLCIIMMGRALQAGASPVVGMLVCILTGALCGVLNGALVVLTNITPFIVTLATMSVFQGLVNLLYPEQRITLNAKLFDTIAFGDVFGIPITIIITAVIFILFLLMLNRTRLGRYTYAIGSNEKNAIVAGINIKKYKFMIYMISGICAGIGALILGSRVGVVQKTSGGVGVVMDVVTAVILGGTGMEGGEGTVVGTLTGVIVLQFFTSAMVLLNMPTAAQDVAKGLVIVVGMIFMRRMRRDKVKFLG